MVNLPNESAERCADTGGIAASQIALSRPELDPNQASKKAGQQRFSRRVGLTGREYQVLRILNSYGWLTPKMVRQIAVLHEIPWQSNSVYRILTKLFDAGFLVARKAEDGTNTVAYGISQAGLKHVRAHGDALICDTDVEKDPASLLHFINLNRAILTLASEFPTKFWLSDFQVRSDNSAIGASGFAKDYDSVAEFVLPTGVVRVAFEYERWQQSRRRYDKVASVFAAEKYIHQVLVFLDRMDWLEAMMPSFRNLGAFVGFVDYQRFVKEGLNAYTKYWNGDQVYEAPLAKLLEHRCATPRPAYTPIHRLKLRL
jgi:Fe2+ or Zn2+ uptake regulation protein